MVLLMVLGSVITFYFPPAYSKGVLMMPYVGQLLGLLSYISLPLLFDAPHKKYIFFEVRTKNNHASLRE